MSIQFAKRLFNVTEYYRMAEAGILSEDDRVELIEGEIVKMTPVGSRHSACVDRLNTIFNSKLMSTAIVRIQNPIHINEYSEPQPDIALLIPRSDFYAEAHPTSNDVLLIVEVSDTSLEYDRRVKLPLYASALISEVWLIDILKQRIEIHREPSKNLYQEIRYIQRGQSLSPLHFPAVSLNAEEILG